MPTADGVLARRLARLIGGALCLVAGAAVAVPAILLHPAPAELLSGVAVSVAVALGAAVVWLARRLLASQAHLDTITGLPNRALFVDRLDHALGRRRYHTRGAAVLFLDLDDFKTVNDSLGHTEGDNLIGQVAKRLSETVRPGDLAARFGGDEFALLLDDVDEDEAVSVATRTLAALNGPFELTDRAVRIGATVGIALGSAALPTAGEMLRAADIAMYSAKESGKGRFRVFEPSMYAQAAERLRLGVDIRGAVERGE